MENDHLRIWREPQAVFLYEVLFQIKYVEVKS